MGPADAAGPPKPLDDTERSLSLQVALKCADISNLGRELECYKRCAGRFRKGVGRPLAICPVQGSPVSVHLCPVCANAASASCLSPLLRQVGGAA